MVGQLVSPHGWYGREEGRQFCRGVYDDLDIAEQYHGFS
jgi:hypothetical protein